MTQAPSLINLLSANNIVLFMLVFTRLTGLVQTAPFFSTVKIPLMPKLWLCATISFIFYPLVQGMGKYHLPHNMAEFIILLAIEFLIGYLIGFVANLILEGVRMTGSILAIQMGLSMSEALDPATGMNSTEISKFYIYLVTLIFLATGAHQILFASVFNSFQALPMGLFPLFDSHVVGSMLTMFAQLFKIAFGVSLPIFSVLLISDVLLGVMSKMMPHMNIYMVALPVKIYVGLFLMMVFLSGTSLYLQGVIQNYFEAIARIFT